MSMRPDPRDYDDGPVVSSYWRRDPAPATDRCDHTWRFINSRNFFVCLRCNQIDEG